MPNPIPHTLMERMATLEEEVRRLKRRVEALESIWRTQGAILLPMTYKPPEPDDDYDELRRATYPPV